MRHALNLRSLLLDKGPLYSQFLFASRETCLRFTKIPQGECWKRLPTMSDTQTYLLIKLSCLEFQKSIYLSIKFNIGKCK